MSISLGEAISLFLSKSRFKNDVQALQIVDVWEKIMGKTVAKYTNKIQIINGTLFITTTVGPLKQELHFQKTKIIEMVNKELGENIICKVVIQ